ncbi:MAG: heme biosynthesis HemY N-terminal domain-containing protein [Pseudomonadota bacterium]
MIRILIFFIWVVFLAGAITILATFDSRITGEAFGQKFDGPSSIILGGLFAVFLLTIYTTHKIKDIMGLPARIRARDAETKRSRGVAALTRGLEAVAVGDAADASHHAKIAQRHLQDMALTRLLTAQAAQLAGDEAEAEKSFSAMLDAPETEFMGLKGLYLQAMAKDDLVTARRHAERAFSLRANAGWAFQSVVELGLERGAWGETRDAIAKGKRNKIIAEDKANRSTAALLTADAYAARLSGDDAQALKEVESALKLCPALTPAATLAAELYETQKKSGKAAKILETAFTAEPHPALIRSYDKLYESEPSAKRAEKLRALAAKNEDSVEATLLQARASNLLGEWATAMTKLEPVLTSGPTAHAYALMAQAAAGLHGAEAARPWLERAASASRDPRPGADNGFHFTKSGWARLVREYAEHARLGPPPLEDAVEPVSAEEIKLLTAPPVSVKPEVAAELDAQETSVLEDTIGTSTKDIGKDIKTRDDGEKPDIDKDKSDAPSVEETSEIESNTEETTPQPSQIESDKEEGESGRNADEAVSDPISEPASESKKTDPTLTKE